MKQLLLITALSIGSLSAAAQQYEIKMQAGTLFPQQQSSFSLQPSPSDIEAGRIYRLIQFHKIPNAEQLKLLQANDVKLLHYIPNNTYFASFPLQPLPANYATLVRSITRLSSNYKKDEFLLHKKYPNWAKKSGEQLEVLISFAEDISIEKMRSLLPALWQDQAIFIKGAHSFRLTITPSNLDQLLTHSYILFAECFDDEPQPEEFRTRSSHRSNLIDQRHTNNLQLRGNTINVALNDDGVIGPHVDYTGRLAAQYISNNNGDHGDHCGGIIIGAGNLNPKAEGMASGADIHVYGVGGFPSGYQAFDSLYNHYNTKSIRVVSTSYGQGANAGYTALARSLDIQHLAMPKVMHVFSAGNSGASTQVSSAGPGWFTITGGHKAGKNVTTVGNVTYTDALAGSSSRGPAKDGRIKPEICAVGTSVYSTIDVNTYASFTGTSMSCPGIAGVYAQLMEGYKLIKNGNEVPASLLKGILMNSADDLGNSGPDFKYGYGRVNAARAYGILEAEQYIIDSLSHGDSLLFPIDVPAGVSQLRVMLNWPDKEGAANAAIALVNDLNLTLANPSATVFLPWVLNSAPNASLLDAPAIRFTDSLNNMEQVTINNPMMGFHTVKIKGKTVPFGPQKFYINYEFLYDTPKVVYPIGREGLIPGQVETIRWDAYGNTGTFTLSYSTNNGASFTNIVTNLPASQRYYDWTVPNTVSAQAKVRVTRNNVSAISPLPFTIINAPSGINIDWVCGDSLKVSYNPVAGATSYVVSILGDKYMDSAGVSTTTSCVARKVGIQQGGWLSVQALIDSTGKGRRAIAEEFAAAPFNCAVLVDLEMVSISSPTRNDVFDCDSSSFIYPVTVQIKNNTANTQSNFQIGYTINGVNAVVESLTGSLAPSATTSFTFGTFATLGNGENSIEAFVIHPNDVTPQNDTALLIKRTVLLDNIDPSINPIQLSFDNLSLCDTAANCSNSICDLGTNWYNLRNAVEDGADWRVHTGSTPSRGLGNPTGPMAGNPGKYIYLEADNCFQSTATLMSPCLLLSPGSSMELSYDVHLYGNNMGTLYVDIFDGTNWSLGIQQTSGNLGDQWITKSINLSNFAGKTINIRFRGTTLQGNLGDMAIDNISVKAANSANIVLPTEEALTIFPNPAENTATIRWPQHLHATQIQVLDVTGRVITEQKLSDHHRQFLLDAKSWAAGVYLIKLTTREGIATEHLIRK